MSHQILSEELSFPIHSVSYYSVSDAVVTLAVTMCCRFVAGRPVSDLDIVRGEIKKMPPPIKCYHPEM